jgi:dynein light intermediate chain 1
MGNTGGTVDSQRDLLESLSSQDQRRIVDRGNAKLPPVANNFALGYTYYDVLDADQEDILARISMYTLTSPSPAFSTLLQPLLTPQSIRNTLIVILLDWSQPWKWMRQLRQWILLLRTVLVSLSNESKETMEEVMLSWRDRGRQGGTTLDGSGAAATSEGDVALPLGPGEWEDALGLPLCVVCQNVSSHANLCLPCGSANMSCRPSKWECWRRRKAGRRRSLMSCCNSCARYY